MICYDLTDFEWSVIEPLPPTERIQFRTLAIVTDPLLAPSRCFNTSRTGTSYGPAKGRQYPLLVVTDEHDKRLAISTSCLITARAGFSEKGSNWCAVLRARRDLVGARV